MKSWNTHVGYEVPDEVDDPEIIQRVQEMGLERTYYFADVEPAARMHADLVASARDELHAAARKCPVVSLC